MKTRNFCARIASRSFAFVIMIVGGSVVAMPSLFAHTDGTPTLPSVLDADSTQLLPDELQRKEIIKNTKVIYVNGEEGERVGRDSVNSVLAKFYDDQFRNSQDPESPYFTFVSKNADLTMGIGGSIKLRGWFDWNGMVDAANFNTYKIEMPKTPEDMKNLGATASGSSLFFSIIGHNSKIGHYKGYIQGGFNGYGNSGFKLKKAWFAVYDFTLGLAPTTFSDPAAQPDLLDGAGANGKIDKTNVLVRYLRTFKGKWTVAGSVEFPKSQPNVDATLTKKCRDYVPDIAALAQYQWDRGQSHVRVAGILRTMAYRDLVTNTTRHNTGWGVQLSGVVCASRYMKFFAQGSVGQGISSYTGDLSIGNYDLLALPGEEGRLYAPTTYTATVGLKGYWMPNLTSTVAVATLRNMAKAGASADTYKYGQYLAVNLIYDITSRLQAGVEYEAGVRKNVDGAHANANRAQAVFTVSF